MSDSNQGTNGEESSGGIKGDAAVFAFTYARSHLASVADAKTVSIAAAEVVNKLYKKLDDGKPVVNFIKEQNEANTAEVMVAAMEAFKFISGNSMIKLKQNLEDVATTGKEIDNLLKPYLNVMKKKKLTDDQNKIFTDLQTVKEKNEKNLTTVQKRLSMENDANIAAQAIIDKYANAIWKAKKTAEEFCTPLRF